MTLLMAAENERQEDESIDYHAKLRKYMYCEDDSIEDLRQTLKQGFEATRNKICILQADVLEKQQNLDQEHELRVHAEHELSMLSIDDGGRSNSTPSPASTSEFSEKNLPVTDMKTPTRNLQESNSDELEIAREQNRTLKQKLSQVERRHEKLLQTKEDMQLELDAQFTARGAALIDKIYTAQKEREESIKTRLKLVTEEKEELTKKVKKLEKDNGVDSGVETNSMGDELWLNADMSLDEIVGRVVHGKHSQSIEFNGEVVVDCGSKVHKKRTLSSSSEFKKIKDELDIALKQVEQLTDELHEAQRERSMFEIQRRKSEKNRLKILQNQMKGIIKERDKALQKVQVLEDELQHYQLHQGSNNSLPGQTNLQKQFNLTLEDYKYKLNENDAELLSAQSAYDGLHNKLNRIVNEKNDMEMQLQQAVIKSNEDKKRADKLERLLIALRRRKER